MTSFTQACLESCSPPQVINFNIAFNDISSIKVNDNCGEISKDSLQYGYSIDGTCWSCYMSYEEALAGTVDLNSDFYLRIKVAGNICSVTINDTPTTDYTTALAEGFNFTACSTQTSSNIYNPYANMDGAIALQQNLVDTVSCMFGIPIYYFKLAPNVTSKDLTFKEYTLMDVESVKQIKLLIADGTMPSSRPEFTDFGIEFQTDWETEIAKSMFATAFGPTAQPMEGDLIYIPMMKRMWMVNGAYEEKNESLMWIATTFKVSLVKYQEKGSVNLGDTEALVNTFVKNKYDDLFGDDDNQTYDSGTDATDAPKYAANSLYPVFESDATRKYISCDTVDIRSENIYYKGTLIADSKYEFINNGNIVSQIVYQKPYCGEEGSISFIINPMVAAFSGTLLSLGNISINIEQDISDCILSVNIDERLTLHLAANSTFFVILRWSKCMNTCDFSAYKYVYNTNIPRYKLNSAHYWFDMDNTIDESVISYNDEFIIYDKSELILHNFNGWITNIKLFDVYNDDLSELLQMYPTHQHLMINDTARPVVGLPGVALH